MRLPSQFFVDGNGNNNFCQGRKHDPVANVDWMKSIKKN